MGPPGRALDSTKVYAYTVTAQNAVGTSTAVTFTPVSLAPPNPAGALPDTPRDLVASFIGASVAVTWNPATTGTSFTAVGYELSRNGTVVVCFGVTLCAQSPGARVGTS